MFYTDSQLKQALAGVLKKAPSGQDGLPAHWNEIVKAANRRAYVKIVSALVGRGFQKSDIDAWEEGWVFQRCLGIKYAITDGGLVADYGETYLSKLDQCEEELKTISLVDADGDLVSTVGGISHGTLDTSEDRFVQETSEDDDRIGETTKW